MKKSERDIFVNRTFRESGSTLNIGDIRKHSLFDVNIVLIMLSPLFIFVVSNIPELVKRIV